MVAVDVALFEGLHVENLTVGRQVVHGSVAAPERRNLLGSPHVVSVHVEGLQLGVNHPGDVGAAGHHSRRSRLRFSDSRCRGDWRNISALHDRLLDVAGGNGLADVAGGCDHWTRGVGHGRSIGRDRSSRVACSANHWSNGVTCTANHWSGSVARSADDWGGSVASGGDRSSGVSGTDWRNVAGGGDGSGSVSGRGSVCGSNWSSRSVLTDNGRSGRSNSEITNGGRAYLGLRISRGAIGYRKSGRLDDIASDRARAGIAAIL